MKAKAKAKVRAKARPLFVKVGWEAFLRHYQLKFDRDTGAAALMSFSAGAAMVYWTLKKILDKPGKMTRADQLLMDTIDAEMTGIADAFDKGFDNQPHTTH